MTQHLLADLLNAYRCTALVMEGAKELDNEVLEALYPETEIVENGEAWCTEQCLKCGETFRDEASKERHTRLNHARAFICEVCGKGFSQRSGLTHHLPTHSAIKAFTCDVCGKGFRQRSGLTHHKQTHSERKAFTCQVCGKAFAQGSGLIHHRWTHSGVKSFACDLCGKRFSQRSGLTHHKRTHTQQSTAQSSN